MGSGGFFADYMGRKIALYGLGAETAKAIAELENDFEIIGLLDGFREDGEMYGQPIVSFTAALNEGVGLIVAVARPGSCRAIAKRIGNACRKEGIALMDIRGNDLLAEAEAAYDFANIDGIAKAELMAEIREADIASFDLFDTLIVRQALSPEDVISLVECRLREKGAAFKDFCKKRLESEKELSRDAAPNLTQIYADMLEKSGMRQESGISAEWLAGLEWETDFGLIIPRKEVCEIFNEAVGSGKKAYVVSDTYYSAEQLAQILEKCGIAQYAGILSSSDYKTGKRQGLYDVLKGMEKGRKILHVGDDVVSDAECAQKRGLEARLLMSAADLFEKAGNLGLRGCCNSVSERLKTGMFIARLFNSPFRFESADRRIMLPDAYDIGYLLCAPVISDFAIWLYSELDRRHIRNIWFAARDGYLIKKMYACLAESYGKEDESEYFLTSRTAAVRACVMGGDDIRYVDGMKFSGTLGDSLLERFGIREEEIDGCDISPDKDGLMKYEKAVLKKASEKRRNYRKYIEKLGVKEGETAFFDFVAKGTSQMYIQRLAAGHLKGFYFMRLEPEGMKDKGLDIVPFYDGEKGKGCAVFDDYYILETILTAPHPSVADFDEDGNPVYAAETRTAEDIRCFMRAQEGIMDYFEAYIRLCPEAERTADMELDGKFLKLIHKLGIADKDFLGMKVEDPFFNRMTKITDVI